MSRTLNLQSPLSPTESQDWLLTQWEFKLTAYEPDCWIWLAGPSLAQGGTTDIVGTEPQIDVAFVPKRPFGFWASGEEQGPEGICSYSEPDGSCPSGDDMQDSTYVSHV